MMLQIVSDLHLNHWGVSSRHFQSHKDFLEEIQTEAPVLAIAGDTFSLRRSDILWTEARIREFLAMYKHILYVPGNHEYYGTWLDEGLLEAQKLAAKFPDLHVLTTGNPVTIEGQRFVGDVMWFPESPDTAKDINDFRAITDFEPLVYEEHERFKTWCEKNLEPSDVVITHHAPSFACVNDKYKGSSINDWFVARDMEPIILDRKPKLWIHGHMHDPVDVKVGDTRIIANPRGYPGEFPVQKFNPKCVVEL